MTKAPRTPWGNLTEAGTPLEKPTELEGRTLSEISGEELRTIKRQAAEGTITAFLGPTEAPSRGPSCVASTCEMIHDTRVIPSNSAAEERVK